VVKYFHVRGLTIIKQKQTTEQIIEWMLSVSYAITA